jgi:hypothetical protein
MRHAQLANLIADIATGEVRAAVTPDGKQGVQR